MNNSDAQFSTFGEDTASRVSEAKFFLDTYFGAVTGEKWGYLWTKKSDGGRGGSTIPYLVSDADARAKMAVDAIKFSDLGFEVYFGVNCGDAPLAANERYKTKLPKNPKVSDEPVKLVTCQTATVTDIDTLGGNHIDGKKFVGDAPVVYPKDIDTAKQFLPFPVSIIVSSGYGMHGHCLYKEPLTITADNANAAESRNKNFLDVIRSRAGIYRHVVDGVHDLPRILRVPGTRNYKTGFSKTAPMCHIVEVNDVRFSPDELDEKIAPLLPSPSPEKKTTQKQKSDSNIPEINFSRKKRDGALSKDIQQLIDDINANITDTDLLAKGYLEQSVNGDYCCPWCDSGHGEGQSGAMHYYPEGHFCCFSTRKYPKTHGGDIVAFLAQIYEMQMSGKEFFDLLKRIVDDFSIPHDPKIFEYTPRRDFQNDADNLPIVLSFPPSVAIDNNTICLDFSTDDKEKIYPAARTLILPTKKFVSVMGDGLRYEVAIRLPSGEWKRADVDARTLQEPRLVYELAQHGAIVSNAKLLTIYFSEVLGWGRNYELIPEVKVFNRPGWYGEKFIYPTPTETDNYRVERTNIEYKAIFSTRGDANKWLEMFRQVTDTKSNQLARYVQFAVGACVVAPLIKVFAVKNIQINFWGTSNRAKTLLPKIGLSAFGNPAEGKMFRTWDSSANNRLAMSMGFCDLPILIDEGESMSKTTRNDFSRDVYNYFAGITNQKNKRNGDSRRVENFRGSRILTAERPMLTYSDKQGAFKRIIDVHINRKIFADGEARDLHLFVESNYGHYGRKWCNYIAENRQAIRADFDTLCRHFKDAGFGTNFNPVKFEAVDATNARSVIACAVAFYHFLTCLGLKQEFDTMLAIVLAEEFLEELPRVEDFSDSHRSLALVASWIAEHPTQFIRPKRHNSNDPPPIDEADFSDDIPAQSYAGTVGREKDNGDIAIFQNAFREIILDKLKLPSVEKVLSDLYELGAIDCASRQEPRRKVPNEHGQRVHAYVLKAKLLFPKDEN